MSRRSLFVRCAVWCGVAVAVLVGLRAVSNAPAPPSASIAAMAALGPAATSPSPAVTPTPCAIPCTTAPIIQIVGCDWCGLAFRPSEAQVYGSSGYAYTLVNQTAVDVTIADMRGTPVAVIRAGASVDLRAPGPGTYQLTVISPRSATPPTLTIVASAS